MFESLSNRLGSLFDKLRGKGVIGEADIDAAMREIRVALLEADVALPAVKAFSESFKAKALGAEVVQSVSPAQMIIKLVQDHLTELLGDRQVELNLATQPPAVILMAGLQGSGKTTSTGKLALYLKEKLHKKPMVASLDVYRPAAQEQLRVVANQAGVESLPIVAGEKPLAITERALKEARLSGMDVLILDTAGRLAIDDELMSELEQVKKLAAPIEVLLVADSLTGQDAVRTADTFHQRIGITGIVLTRLDGDGRGGAALSMRHVTGQPIKFAGVGEKLSEFEPFHPERIASRILDKGDIVSLVEKAASSFEQEEAEKLAKKFEKGQFDLEDMAAQLRQIRKMGDMNSILGMLPGIGKMKKQIEEANIDPRILLRQEAIISSMTLKERRNPKILNASRRKRIASGSGTSVQDINRLLKQYQQMETVMKQMKKLGQKGLARGGLKALFGG